MGGFPTCPRSRRAGTANFCKGWEADFAPWARKDIVPFMNPARKERAPRPSIFASGVSGVAAIALNACSQTDDPLPPPVSQMEACAVTLLALRANTSDDRPWRLWTHEPVIKNEHWRSEEVLRQPQWYTIDPTSGRAVPTLGPSPAMAKAVADTVPATGITCPNVEGVAVEADRRFAHLGRPRTTDPDSDFVRPDVMIERAVLSPDGREAVVYLGQQEAPLSGLGELILFRKSRSGQWAEAARMGVWVS